ncbi:MAG: dihydroorotate dehydrogenase-like protein [Fimbriimonadaceae bacterium]
MNLESTYLGLHLKNPVVASASPLSRDLDGMRRLEDVGTSAIVMFSMFEEQILHESASLGHYLDYGAESFAEAVSYLPEPQRFHAGPDEYLLLIQNAKASLEIPVIGSLNGVTAGGWAQYARLMQEAGADAIELNVYHIPADPEVSGSDVERLYVEAVAAVSGEVDIPVAVKLGPYFSSVGHVCRQLVAAGADGLVLFNRFYQPDFDLENLEVVPRLVLSGSHEMRLPLHWVAMLFGKVDADFAVTTGVHNHQDVLKAMMAGARCTMLASELLQRGPGRVREILDALVEWMEEYEYESIRQMQGSMSAQRLADPTAFSRANYMKELQSYRPDPAGSGWR